MLLSTISNGSNESTVSKKSSTANKLKLPPSPPITAAPPNPTSTATTVTTSKVRAAPSLDALKESTEMLEINNMLNDEQCSVFTTDSICTQDVIDHIEEMEESTPSTPKKTVSKPDEKLVSPPKDRYHHQNISVIGWISKSEMTSIVSGD